MNPGLLDPALWPSGSHIWLTTACCLSEAGCPAKLNVTVHVPTRKKGGKKRLPESRQLGVGTPCTLKHSLCSSLPPREVGSVSVCCLLKPYSSPAWLLGQLLTGAFLVLPSTVTPELGLKNSGWQAAVCPPTVSLTSFRDQA